MGNGLRRGVGDGGGGLAHRRLGRGRREGGLIRGGQGAGGGEWFAHRSYMYIYHALIKALSAHMMHINLNTIFCTHVVSGLLIEVTCTFIMRSSRP